MNKYLIILIPLIIFFGCSIPVERVPLKSYNISDGSKAKIYFSDVGATGKAVIQVGLIRPDGNEVTAQNFEHDFLQKSALINDSTLMLILTDSGSVRFDTVKLQLFYRTK